MTNPQLRRFWIDASVVPYADGYAVALDGKIALTPQRAVLATQHKRLAEAAALEWANAPPMIDPRDMPLTGFLNAVIDRVRGHASVLGHDVANLAAHELICYRTDGPPELARRQAAAWDPILDWLKARYDVALIVTVGVMHIAQPHEGLTRLAVAVSALDPYRLAAATKSSGLLKSLALTLALLDGRLTARDAYAASRIDESFQAEHWGVDAEAARKTAREEIEIDQLAQFLSCLDYEGAGHV